jgi:peptidyl-prolyl cis-trans isomerase A (cyclophilin A)
MTGAILAGAAVAGLLALNLVPPPAGADDPKPVVVIETSMGNITVELDPAKAPITVENYLKYVDAGFYDGTIFHRVMPDFMIQGGGMLPNMKEKDTNPPIKLEAKNGLSNKRGTIAMARTSDPNSATSQFFINHADNENLDTYGGGYAVFGRVTEGMDVVDKIAQVRTTNKGPHQNVPVEPVTIKSIKRLPQP